MAPLPLENIARSAERNRAQVVDSHCHRQLLFNPIPARAAGIPRIRNT